MINLGLSRITSLLRPLFSTHESLPWRAIHIAGTNGKGSIASYISSLLSHQGYKVGRFTSPHLINRWDCISLNSQVVEKDAFLELEAELKERSVREGIEASEFEILTAVAFELFTRHGVDFGVVECGLGGRLDATNALRQQDVSVSVLAKVGLDHTEFLGATVEAVAREKCGIFKKGVSVVVDESNDQSVKDVVRDKLKEVNADAGEAMWSKLPAEHQNILANDGLQELGLADHQRQNLLTACTAYYAAERQVSISNSPKATSLQQRIRSTIECLPALIQRSHASIRGRLEWLSLPAHLLPATGAGGNIKVLIDGAHNPQSAIALASYVNNQVRKTSPGKPITWVIAMKRGKEIDTVLTTLLQNGDNVITCSFGQVDGMPWVESLGARELAEQVRSLIAGKTEVATQNGDVASAIRRGVLIAEGGPLCIVGSLYLVGDVLRLVQKEEP